MPSAMHRVLRDATDSLSRLRSRLGCRLQATKKAAILMKQNGALESDKRRAVQLADARLKEVRPPRPRLCLLQGSQAPSLQAVDVHSATQRRLAFFVFDTQHALRYSSCLCFGPRSGGVMITASRRCAPRQQRALVCGRGVVLGSVF